MDHEPRTIFVGGTFDGLHLGHQVVLKAAFASGDHVTIGLTTDDFVAKYKLPYFPNSPHHPNRSTHSFSRRKQKLLSWLKSQGFQNRATIAPISDPYEPASSAPYDALIVTKDNRSRGEEINLRRRTRGLPAVQLIEVPLVPSEDDAPISSTRLRNGEIDPNGRLIMPESLRHLLRKPLGQVLVKSDIISHLGDLSDLGDLAPRVITVGDMATQTLIDVGRSPDLSIIDQKLERKPVDTLKSFGNPKSYKLYKITSGPGYISSKAINLISYNLKKGPTFFKGPTFLEQKINSIPGIPGIPGISETKKPIVILVSGEEDLLALPAVIYAPIGSIVYYGQPPHAGGQSGLVEVKVTPQTKARARSLLKKFFSPS